VSGIPAGPFVVTLFVTAGTLLAMMGVTFAVALKARKHSVVDTAWGIGLALVAVASLLATAGHGQPARRYVLLAASVIWGLRLAAYVTWRNRGSGEDPRYRDLLNRAKGNRNLYALRAIYLPQALIMDRGLWQYTRHPNYFGDACMWWGLFLIAMGSRAGLLTIFAPLLMTFILTRGTGQRLTEQRMAATRPQYADYAARTSGFIPLPPRRHPDPGR
jgi:steroid 5-alpha reductase family enzyme